LPGGPTPSQRKDADMAYKIKLTSKLLSQVGTVGKFAVGELLENHEQPGCTTIPAGTRFRVSATKDGNAVALIPHDVLPHDLKVWSDGYIRIIPQTRYKIVGRMDAHRTRS
jgi:hypothetical protein